MLRKDTRCVLQPDTIKKIRFIPAAEKKTETKKYFEELLLQDFFLR
jgi:hypothetical protein